MTQLAKLQDGMRDNGNVKSFGAVGDGVTDDTVAIQAAIDSGSPSVYFEEGAVYLITSGLVGRERLTLYSNASTDQSVPVLYCNDPDTTILSFSSGLGVTIRGIGFDHRTTVGTGKAIDMFNPIRSTVERCHVLASPEGFDFRSGPSPAPAAGNCIIKDNSFATIGGTCLHLFRTHNDFITGNRVITDAGKGLHMEQSCYDNMIVANEFSHAADYAIETDGNSVGHLIEANIFAVNNVDLQLAGRSFTIVGNLFKESNQNALFLNVFRDSSIVGNKFRGSALDADAVNRYSCIYGQNAIENVTIADNVFGSELTATARYAVALRFSKNCIIKGNQMERGYVEQAILNEFPSGINEFEEAKQELRITVTDVAAGTDSVRAAFPLTGSGFITATTVVSPGRALTVTIKNTTGSDLVIPDLQFYTIGHLFRTDIPSQTIPANGSATFTGRADNTDNSRVVLNSNGATVPAGLTYECGVSDRFRVSPDIPNTDGLSGFSDGAALTISAFDIDDHSFEVSPSPAAFSTNLFAYKKQFNII